MRNAKVIIQRGNIFLAQFKYEIHKNAIVWGGGGYVIFCFTSSKDCDKVLMRDPYSFHKKHPVMQNLEIDFEFNPDYFTIILL